jgi:DinB family protein
MMIGEEGSMARDPLRAQLLRLLDGVDAHMPFEAAVLDFPDEAMNRRPPNVDYTPWHLIEHLRLTQADILDYVTNPEYVGLEWPREYWPDPSALTTRAEWDATIAGFLADRATIRGLVADDDRDLFAVLPGTPGHTLLREVRIIADHNAYHVGEFAILRQVMGTWPAGHDG